MYRYFLIFLLLIFTIPLFAQDWKKVEEDYTRERAVLENSEPAKTYSSVNYLGETLVTRAAPELGIGVHLPDDNAVKDLKALGIRYVRFTMYWYEVEPEKGKYDEEALARYDKRFDVLLKNDMIPVVVVHGNPGFVSFGQRGKAYRDYAEFMAMCAARWKKCRYWELWNEMDTSFTGLFGAENPKIPAEARGRYYAEMLKVTCTAMKKANPDVRVVLGSVAGDITPFMKGVYAAGGRGYFDIMNIHTYGLPVIWNFVLRGVEAHRIMEQYGDGKKPVWNTEFGQDAGGYISGWGKPESLSAFDDFQTEQLTECAKLNRQTGLYDKCFIFQYLAGAEGGMTEIEEMGGNPEDYTYGIMREDGTPRPAYEALKKLQINADIKE